MLFCCFFFFSSRRRHTRFDCDWSSDVCSSDLHGGRCLVRSTRSRDARLDPRGPPCAPHPDRAGVAGGCGRQIGREGGGGKGGGSGGGGALKKKKKKKDRQRPAQRQHDSKVPTP